MKKTNAIFWKESGTRRNRPFPPKLSQPRKKPQQTSYRHQTARKAVPRLRLLGILMAVKHLAALLLRRRLKTRNSSRKTQGLLHLALRVWQNI